MAKKPLTERQQEILSVLEEKGTVAEAAKALGIKPAAVYGHIGRIREAGHKVVLSQRSNGRRSNGSGSLPPADMPPLRSDTAAAANGALDGSLARIDKETDEALAQEKAALEEAKAEREKLTGLLAEVDAVIEQRTATLGVSARLHNAPITS
jgi:predicted DNA-binding transcriptional regulator YafY